MSVYRNFLKKQSRASILAVHGNQTRFTGGVMHIQLEHGPTRTTIVSLDGSWFCPDSTSGVNSIDSSDGAAGSQGSTDAPSQSICSRCSGREKKWDVSPMVCLTLITGCHEHKIHDGIHKFPQHVKEWRPWRQRLLRLGCKSCMLQSCQTRIVSFS